MMIIIMMLCFFINSIFSALFFHLCSLHFILHSIRHCRQFWSLSRNVNNWILRQFHNGIGNWQQHTGLWNKKINWNWIWADRSFSFLSADEIEKLRQENEKKIATITRETKKKIASATTASDNINNNDQFDVNEDDEEFYRNKNLIISQHVMEAQYEEDEDANGR